MDSMFTVILVAYVWFSLILMYVTYKATNLWYQYDLMFYIASHYVVDCHEERLIPEVTETRAAIKRKKLSIIGQWGPPVKGTGLI